ncbi:MAG: 2-amino-4-hydroxy-6-hydroxymethyldihydropteridine diphosphokinase [Gammaproteobacteria bacterium]|nr:MAG: 2-amino-4-hydroxy-6-hydroxymethyldihydropteridine diphosphokinase [Gammaproteobacteria bacterium]
MLAYVGLGSNLDDPIAHVIRAFRELEEVPDTKLIKRSAIYRSRPVGPGNQPDYINAAALLQTELEPLALLDALQAIEHSHDRVRIEHWGPRTLDLDILLLDNRTITSDRLNVPHPYLAQRNFVLYPLADIEPDLKLPNGTSLRELIAACQHDGLERLES